jgi:hypothetical protein
MEASGARLKSLEFSLRPDKSSDTIGLVRWGFLESGEKFLEPGGFIGLVKQKNEDLE